ncbi:unnamed protein product [Thlaspi arvense]|uniref:Uncharacterized protein n=1 Tax=Thlaspi arvense TaxID=13288 RepID=A0AAU9R6S8_THLAR|nr:unnamed protein product [Thlaspi arvense]
MARRFWVGAISGCAMEEHCLVIAGEWLCGKNAKWDFVVDKQRMSRVVLMREDMKICDLTAEVLKEFCIVGVSQETMVLSYWPPNTNELATRIKTPPVVDSMNLFATFDILSGAIGYTTPNPSSIRVGVTENSASRLKSVSFASGKETGPSIGRVEDVVPSSKRVIETDSASFSSLKQRTLVSSMSGGSSSSFPFDLNALDVDSVAEFCSGDVSAFSYELSDADIISEVESVENRFHSSRAPSSEGTDEFDEEDYCGDLDDEEDIISVGYDNEFWEPLIDDALGGSDAVEFMCPAGDGFDGKAVSGGKMCDVLRVAEEEGKRSSVGGGGSKWTSVDGQSVVQRIMDE